MPSLTKSIPRNIERAEAKINCGSKKLRSFYEVPSLREVAELFPLACAGYSDGVAANCVAVCRIYTYIRVNSTARLRGFYLLLRRFQESIRTSSDSFPWNFPSPFLQT